MSSIAKKNDFEKRLMEMADIQDTFNCVVADDWYTRGFDFLLAALGEGWEAIDHWGWKWWKKQEPNLEQVQMELVDIWHFILSDLMVKNGDLGFAHVTEEQVENVYGEYLAAHFTPYQNEYFISEMTSFIGSCADGWVDFQSFFNAMKLAQLSFDDLYKMYVGKASLNAFRQANGYKDGTYIKEWKAFDDGVVREDNEFLQMILNDMGNPDDVQGYIWSKLGEQYEKELANAE